MQGHGRIIAHDFCVAHREANSGLSTLNRTKSILSIYHQQRQLQKQRGMCLNDTYPLCQQPLSDNCHSICFSKPVLWTATRRAALLILHTEISHVLRISYVQCSTGVNRATRTVYRALGNPDWTAARRAFLAGCTFGEWYAETKCLFCATALFRVPASLFCILFSDKPEKSMPPEAVSHAGKKRG